MSLRYNEETKQVERERVEFDVVSRTDLEAAVTNKQAELDAVNAEKEAAHKLLEDTSARASQLEDELGDLKSDLGDFDSVSPVPSEDENAEAVPGVEPGGESDETVVPVQF